LSIDEATRYFANHTARQAKMVTTITDKELAAMEKKYSGNSGFFRQVEEELGGALVAAVARRQ
jgi:hypothetical protein